MNETTVVTFSFIVKQWIPGMLSNVDTRIPILLGYTRSLRLETESENRAQNAASDSTWEQTIKRTIIERKQMGLISGSGSFSRYQVKGEPGKDFLQGLAEKIGHHVFRNLTEDSTRERFAGWVNVMDMFDNRFRELEFLKEPYIAMSMRVDERRIPATAIKQYCLEAEEKIKTAENLDFLHKNRRADIRDGVKLRLLKRAIPGSRVYDMVWNYSTGNVVFGCTNTKLCDEFQELFLKTFDLHLLAMCPFTLGSGFLEKKGDPPDLMDSLSPSNIWEAP